MKPFAQMSSLALAAILLAACGDTVTEQINANVGAVETSNDLPECTKEIAGQTAFVSETHEFLGCDGSEWQSLSASTVSVGDNVCMSKSLSDGSGFEIFCNGESIGTVKNGEKGEPGEKGADGEKGDKGDDGAPGAKGDKGDDGAKGDPGDPGKNGTNGTNGTGCEITESTALTATIACGSETFTMDLTGYVEQPAECDATLYEDCTGPMDNVELSGVSQKGPFVTGADITAYELENGRSLKQTGKTFGGKIEREDGTFDIKTVQLKSPFVYLVADGFYRNEVTGEKSASPIKLRALTNRQDHTNTNINLVTHLEYDRIVYLVTKKDSSVLKAKMAAEKEIFAAFGIDNTNFKGFAEDYNILEEGDGNAALLAISVLLQGDHTEAEITTLLASLSVDLGDNGEWDNKRERARIADWAMKKTFSKEGLASVRKNIKDWNLRDGEPPAFEGYILNFWQNELGVGECSESNKNAIKAATNKYSAYYAQKDSVFTEDDSSLVRLICAADGESFAWRIATDLEKDVAALSPELPEDTAVFGNINTNYVYVKNDGWRRGTELDAKLDFDCVEDRVGKTDSMIVKRDTLWYICDKNDDGVTPPYVWREATTAEADTALFGTPGDGEPIVKKGNVNRSFTYVYEDGKWRYGTNLDEVPGLGPCLLADSNTIRHASGKDSSGNWYKCVTDKIEFVNGEQLPCLWRELSAQETDTAGINERAAEIRENNDYSGLILKGNLTDEVMNYYIYESGKWRRADPLEIDTYDMQNYAAWGPETDSYVRQGLSGRYYVYDSLDAAWKAETSPLDHLYDLGGCTRARSEFEIVKKEDIEGKYQPNCGNCQLSESSCLENYSVHANEYFCFQGYPTGLVKRGSDGIHYLCVDGLWRIASAERIATYNQLYERQSPRFDRVYTIGNKKYHVEADTFRYENESEKWARENLAYDSRCGVFDTIGFVGSTVGVRWFCKNGFFEWDGVPQYDFQRLTDGKTRPYEARYNQVAIGNQIWVAQNLKVIPDFEGDVGCYKASSWDNNPDFINAMCDSTGGAYYSPSSMQAACERIKSTTGYCDETDCFHLPSAAEWRTLFSFVEDQNHIGKALKSTMNWTVAAGSDDYLFAVQPAGIRDSRYSTSTGHSFGQFAMFYTSDDSVVVFGTNKVMVLSANKSIWNQTSSGIQNEHIMMDYVPKTDLWMSVRCVANKTYPAPPKNPNK